MTAAPATGIGAERIGSSLHLTLRRPQALNALDLAMVRQLRQEFDRAATDASVSTVLLSGEGERGLCAGGDIRAIHRSLDAGEDIAASFWREEYDLLLVIARFPKPVVVWMDGIVFGGGVGLGMHASHRLVTERTRLAMPETLIGFLPDVGATWRLPKAPDGLGAWMALTGEAIGAGAALRAGLADRALPSAGFDALRERLAALPAGSGAREVDEVLAALETDPPSAQMPGFTPAVGQALASPDLDLALADLWADGGEAARHTLALLDARSPASLHVASRLLWMGAHSRSLAECLDREFRAAMRIHREPDFREGVRAAVIDKDRRPRWREWTPEAAADWDLFLGYAGDAR